LLLFFFMIIWIGVSSVSQAETGISRIGGVRFTEHVPEEAHGLLPFPPGRVLV
jgi:hypothetical protein